MRTFDLKFTRQLIHLILITAGLLLLPACGQARTPVEPARSPTASSTLLPSPSLTPPATATLTPLPTATITPVPVSPTPVGPSFEDLSPISLDMIAGLTRIASVELGEGDQLAWSPSGNAFAVSSPSGMRVYRLEAFFSPILIRYQSQPYFSADGTYLAVRLENGNIQVWDLDQGTLVGEYSGLLGEVVHMAFSPTNDLLAAVSVNSQVLVWDLVSGEVRAMMEVPYFVIPVTYTYDLPFSPDQSQLALFREGEALIWEIEADAQPRRLHWEPPPASPVHGPAQFSPDWSAIAWSDRGSILIMDTATGEHLNEFERQVGAPYVFTQDWGSLVTIGYNDTVISVWHPFSGEALQLLEHPETVYYFWLSPDERYLASLTFEGRATLWDLTTGDDLAELTGEEAIGDWLAFSDQADKLALLLSDGYMSVWDVPGAVQRFTLETQATRTFQFSPDGSFLVTVSPTDGLQFWNTIDGEQMLVLDLADPEVDVGLSFVHDRRLLAIQTGDSLQLWGIE